MLYASLYDGECEISRWWDFSCNYSRDNRCRWAWDVAAHGGGLHRLHRSPSLIEWMEPCGVQPAAQEGRPDTPVPPAPTQRLHSLFFKFREASLLRHRGCIVSLSPHCSALVQGRSAAIRDLSRCHFPHRVPLQTYSWQHCWLVNSWCSLAKVQSPKQRRGSPAAPPEGGWRPRITISGRKKQVLVQCALLQAQRGKLRDITLFAGRMDEH